MFAQLFGDVCLCFMMYFYDFRRCVSYFSIFLGHGAPLGPRGSKSREKLRGSCHHFGHFLRNCLVYFPEVMFDDFLEPSFWGPRWRFGAHGD